MSVVASMRSRVWLGGTLVGVLGVVLALSLSRILPPLGGSVLLGSSIGLIIVGPVVGVASIPVRPEPKRYAPTVEARLDDLVESRERKAREEHEKALENFDRLLERVEKMDDPELNSKLSRNFDRFLRRMTAHYPQWDSEGRLRTWLLMKKLSQAISPRNADACLDLVYSTLVTRGAEATEMSQITLSRKVENIYLDPMNEGPHHIAGTLLLMNRGDGAYAKGLVADAIHLWSNERFDRLLPDFAAIREMSASAMKEVEDLLQKEAAKALRAEDVAAGLRSKEILQTILRSCPKAMGQ